MKIIKRLRERTGFEDVRKIEGAGGPACGYGALRRMRPVTPRGDRGYQATDDGG